jgi:hypothetical protein
MRKAATVFAFLFLALVAVIAFFNRPAADDYYYLYCIPENGIFSCVLDLYRGYSARWTAYLLAAVVIPAKWLFVLFPFFIVLLISMFSSGIIKIVSTRLFSVSLSQTSAFTSGVLLCAAFFFTSFSIPESWFWMIQVCTYAMSMAAQLILLYCLMSEKKNALLLLTVAVLAGGSSESYALVLMMALWGLYIYREKLHSTLFPPYHFRFKMMLAFAGCFISFFIMISSKGNLVRYEALPHATPLSLIWIIIKTWGKAFIVKPFLVLPYYLIFGAMAFYAGRVSAVNTRITAIQFISRWIKPVMLLSVIILIMILPATLVMSGPPPNRAMMQVSFTMTAFLLVLFFDAGRKLHPLHIEKPQLKKGIAAVAIVMISFHIVSQYMITQMYAKAYDKRMDYLQMLKTRGQKEMVTLEPLPESGMIYSAEISEYEVHFTNSFLKKYLHLNFEIRKMGVPLRKF